VRRGGGDGGPVRDRRGFRGRGVGRDPVGRVDELEGGEIKLKKDDEEADGHHHFLSVDTVAKVEAQEMRVTLNVTGDEAQSLWRAGD